MFYLNRIKELERKFELLKENDDKRNNLLSKLVSKNIIKIPKTKNKFTCDLCGTKTTTTKGYSFFDLDYEFCQNCGLYKKR